MDGWKKIAENFTSLVLGINIDIDIDIDNGKRKLCEDDITKILLFVNQKIENRNLIGPNVSAG